MNTSVVSGGFKFTNVECGYTRSQCCAWFGSIYDNSNVGIYVTSVLPGVFLI